MDQDLLVAIIASYAAVVSTFTLIWDVIKWHNNKPILKVNILPNMAGGGVDPYLNKVIVITISNVGTAHTQLTHVFAKSYPNKISYYRNKEAHQFFVPSKGIPSVIQPGTQLITYTEQSEYIEKLSHDHLFFIGVYHSMSEKPVMARLMPIPKITDA